MDCPRDPTLLALYDNCRMDDRVRGTLFYSHRVLDMLRGRVKWPLSEKGTM